MRYTIALGILLISGLVNLTYGQNQIPVFSNVRATIEAGKRQMIIVYDVLDAEKDKLKITLTASSDEGITYLIRVINAQGDVGYPVLSGKGKRIVWNYPDTLNYIERYKLKLVADDLVKMDIEGLVNQVDTARMLADMKKVYGIRSQENESSLKHLEEVRALIAKKFVDQGLVAYRQKLNVKGANFQNIIARHAGHEDEAVTYIVSAHFDTEKRSPGADDNGSGVVGMLEASRILSQYNFKRTIRFIGFDGEEVGHIGSKMYIYNNGIKPYEKISGVINYDMIGFYSAQPKSQSIPDGFDQLFPDVVKSIEKNNFRGDFVVNTCNAQSKALGKKFTTCAQRYVPNLKVVSLEATADTPQLAASDHYQFWKQNYPALHIGDGGETRNIHLDTRKDYIHTINYSFISNIVKATIATVAELAELQHAAVSYCTISHDAGAKR